MGNRQKGRSTPHSSLLTPHFSRRLYTKGAEISPNCQILSNFASLNRRQVHAIPSVLAAKSIEEGCRTVGIAKRTWYNWMHDEGFKAAVYEGREALSSEALDRLKAALTRAVEGLTGLVEAEEKNIRLKACSEVIDYFLKAGKLEDLERRLAALERPSWGRRGRHREHRKRSPLSRTSSSWQDFVYRRA